MRVLIAGCGYVGSHLAHRLTDQSHSVCALVRRPDAAASLQQAGVDARVVDVDSPLDLSLCVATDKLVYLIPPPASGREDSRSRHFLAALPPGQLEQVVLISTTGVYGDCSGNWIDESRPLNPTADRAHRRVDAECQWEAWTARHGIKLCTLRVSGIYGWDRLPRARLEEARPVLTVAESPFSNRIHVKDLVDICIAALTRSASGVFNVADNEPSTMTAYFLAVAEALGLPPPPQISLADARRVMSAGMLSYLTESRRIDNRKVRLLLDRELSYPDLASGLAGVRNGPPER